MILDCPKCKESNIAYKNYDTRDKESIHVFRCSECGTMYRLVNGVLEKQIGEVWMVV